MKLLLISNSTKAGEEFLEYPKNDIKKFLGDGTKSVIFVPYAAITISWDHYEERVQEKFWEIGYNLVSIHHFDDPVSAVKNAGAIVVGGGNTFRLVQMLHKNRLTEAVRSAVLEGIPYIGWSAGANVACPAIYTTNDMPVVQPADFSAFNLVRFQINPHYTDAHPPGHAGETRDARITEFIELNHEVYVAGLREGTMLRLEEGKIELIGDRKMKIFKYGITPYEISPGDNADFLL